MSVENYANALGTSGFIAKLLIARGYDDLDEARKFLEPSLSDHLPDPATILGADKACELLCEAIQENKKIGIVSDFDVDGTTACAQLSAFLDTLGVKHYVYIPDRQTDGYGLNRFAVEQMKERGVWLLVTLDCGIANAEEISLAKQAGLKTVIVDHHQLPPNVPDADVIVNPAQESCPFNPYELCASGLVWVLLIRLRSMLSEKLDKKKEEIADLKSYLDLAAIGTICDMVPLVSVNRLIAKKGVELLKARKRIGLCSLIERAGISKLSAGSISWVLGPRINAAGRLDNATEVVELFRTEDKAFADKVSERLEDLNKKRKAVEAAMLEEALSAIDQNNLPAGIVSYDDSNHVGVIGIVASRLVERFHRPSAVVAPSPEDPEILKGSVRSITGFDVSKCLQLLSPLLIAGGGHEMAGGFTIEKKNLLSFSASFNQCARDSLGDEIIKNTRVDCEASFSELSYQAIQELSLLEPFGIGNPRPVFLTKGVTVKNLREIGNNHLKIELTEKQVSLTAMFWRAADRVNVRVGDRVNVIYSPELNSYRGVESVQLVLKEICLS